MSSLTWIIKLRPAYKLVQGRSRLCSRVGEAIAETTWTALLVSEQERQDGRQVEEANAVPFDAYFGEVHMVGSL